MVLHKRNGHTCMPYIGDAVILALCLWKQAWLLSYVAEAIYVAEAFPAVAVADRGMSCGCLCR